MNIWAGWINHGPSISKTNVSIRYSDTNLHVKLGWLCRKMMPRIFFASIKKCIIFSVTRRLEGSGVMNRRSSNNTNKPRSALCFLLYKLATQNGHALSYKVFHFFQFGLKHIFFLFLR